MKKDIIIPKVDNVFVAIVQEEHHEYKTMDWNAYIINNKDVDLDTVLIASKGFSKDKITPVMRHSLKLLPARSYAKIEFMQERLLALNNEFKVSFFEGNQLFDKTYTFKKNTINENALQKIPLMQLKGVLMK
ncbi:hypothetical protein ESY86_08395 [Subsaximicrobium wynnwilliamsii]|uniref:Phenylalanyl-tRNA synthetase subunit alpha n=1 Tax=Subsaximicrobium wynnwilliamsii TaxID=291179 RepID=A0A5C6ZJT6_9FLAO|nr:hypothetical protein [Subsaximicrobium wynnwilliamsii]TXD83718.1 hypothetical protein ESY87_08810 [Subsaximicrobium wynnwilliamsii]TXD89398.1 hypothetical protein ESY86_08395 [Subsaximicrobium wynnwilliamsii]TXE03555.1 hypothetical protein ESY88_07835 [Subsaximicrobium wynnwilliamsii]